MEIIAIILVSDAQFSAIQFNIVNFIHRPKKQSTKKTLVDDCLKFTRNMHAASLFFWLDV